MHRSYGNVRSPCPTGPTPVGPTGVTGPIGPTGSSVGTFRHIRQKELHGRLKKTIEKIFCEYDIGNFTSQDRIRTLAREALLNLKFRGEIGDYYNITFGFNNEDASSKCICISYDAPIEYFYNFNNFIDVFFLDNLTLDMLKIIEVFEV